MADKQFTDDELSLLVSSRHKQDVDYDNLEMPEFEQDPARMRDASGITDVSYSVISGNSNAGNAIVTDPIKFVDPFNINSSWQLIQQLTQMLPLNEFGLPDYIYRPDLLDHRHLSELMRKFHFGKRSLIDQSTINNNALQERRAGSKEIQSMLDAASIALDYSRGYPVLPSGQLLWRKLDFEDDKCYSMFESFLLLGGERQISDLFAYELDELKEISHLFYWNIRAKAFDLYQIAHHQKVKMQRLLTVEDNHYEIANKLLARVSSYLNDCDMNDETLTPEKGINMLEKLVKIQRISVGLPANGESKENNDDSRRSVKPFNVIMQQITQNSGERREQTDNFDELMDDPKLLEAAQEIILKRSGSGHEDV